MIGKFIVGRVFCKYHTLAICPTNQPIEKLIMEIRRDRALKLLSQCRGDEIWSVQHCLDQGVPKSWVDELSDAYESGYRSDSQTIYENGQMTNQYHGVRDLDLAVRLAQCLGISIDSMQIELMDRLSAVVAIKQAVMED